MTKREKQVITTAPSGTPSSSPPPSMAGAPLLPLSLLLVALPNIAPPAAASRFDQLIHTNLAREAGRQERRLEQPRGMLRGWGSVMPLEGASWLVYAGSRVRFLCFRYHFVLPQKRYWLFKTNQPTSNFQSTRGRVSGYCGIISSPLEWTSTVISPSNSGACVILRPVVNREESEGIGISVLGPPFHVPMIHPTTHDLEVWALPNATE